MVSYGSAAQPAVTLPGSRSPSTVATSCARRRRREKPGTEPNLALRATRICEESAAPRHPRRWREHQMAAWSKDELRKITETDDLHIAPFRDDGKTYGTP